jgi:hypothetical protein
VARSLLHSSSSGKHGAVANIYLQTYTKKKDFVLVDAYMDHDGEVGRYILFQDKRKDDDDDDDDDDDNDDKPEIVRSAFES